MLQSVESARRFPKEIPARSSPRQPLNQPGDEDWAYGRGFADWQRFSERTTAAPRRKRPAICLAGRFRSNLKLGSARRQHHDDLAALEPGVLLDLGVGGN